MKRSILLLSILTTVYAGCPDGEPNCYYSGMNYDACMSNMPQGFPYTSCGMISDTGSELVRTCKCDGSNAEFTSTCYSWTSVWEDSACTTEPSPVCGDSMCDSMTGETCTSCPEDCGACYVEPQCGDQICQEWEDCQACPEDCGTCRNDPVCGDAGCNGGETCESCPEDCGYCPPPKPLFIPGLNG